MQALAGVKVVDRINCDARAACAVAGSVWVAERSGHITLRCPRTGSLLDTVRHAQPVVATTITAARGEQEVWVGTKDGNILVFDVAARSVTATLRPPDLQHNGPVHQLLPVGEVVLAAMEGCRAAAWGAETRSLLYALVHPAPVTALVAHHGDIFTGAGDGALRMWVEEAPERGAVPSPCSPTSASVSVAATEERRPPQCEQTLTHATPDPVTCAAIAVHNGEDRAVEAVVHGTCLWAGRASGGVTVVTIDGSRMSIVANLTDATGRLTSLLHVQGRVFGAGVDRAVTVWHAATLQRLARVPCFRGIVFGLAPVRVLETARVWGVGNDGAVCAFDAEGFFAAPAVGEMSGGPPGTSRLVGELTRLRRRLLAETRRANAEFHRAQSKDAELQQALAEAAAQAQRRQEVEALAEQRARGATVEGSHQTSLATENARLTAQLNECVAAIARHEQEAAQLRGAVAAAQQEAAQAHAATSGRLHAASVVHADNDGLRAAASSAEHQVLLLRRELEATQRELRIARDEARRSQTLELTTTRRAPVFPVGSGPSSPRGAGSASATGVQSDDVQRLQDLLILRDVEIRDLTAQVHALTHSRAREAAFAPKPMTTGIVGVGYGEQHQQQQQQSQTDGSALMTGVLKPSHGALQRERDELVAALGAERTRVFQLEQALAAAESVNMDLKHQLEEARGDVESMSEQNAVFQFVTQSRGELTTQLWRMHTAVADVHAAVRSLEQGVGEVEPHGEDRLRIKREWRAVVLSRVEQAVAAAHAALSQIDYIIANYLTDFEKRHLGIPPTRFPPDASRPVVSAEKLLSKLKGVTLTRQEMKQPVPLPAPAAPLPPPGSDARRQFGQLSASQRLQQAADGSVAPVHSYPAYTTAAPSGLIAANNFTF